MQRKDLLVSRVQLALNVDDIDAAVTFYSKLFNTEPAKRRPGYANFAITEPPLKLVLLENAGSGGTMNHLGVEAEQPAEVDAQQARLSAEGFFVDEEKHTTCCYAVQDKFWVTAPDGEKWEHYVVLADSQPELEGETDHELSTVQGNGTCCTTNDAGATICC
jgi:catechol 2,3-dioxygenase-like lactoylglutathione lyase family enzyme